MMANGVRGGSTFSGDVSELEQPDRRIRAVKLAMLAPFKNRVIIVCFLVVRRVLQTYHVNSTGESGKIDRLRPAVLTKWQIWRQYSVLARFS
jgi:hypothetical protein